MSSAIMRKALSLIEEMKDEGISEERIVAIFDAGRFAVMASIFEASPADLGDVFENEAKDPEPHEIMRWEDDGGSVL